MVNGRILSLALTAFAALAASSAASYDDPTPRFQREGNAFSCHMNTPDYRTSEAEDRDVCLRIGPFHTGTTRAEIETLLGSPVKTAQTNSGDFFAYRLQSNASGEMTTYLVASYSAEGKATSLQLTGAPWDGAWPFCGITLGTPEARVVERMGEPLQIDVSDDPGAKQWSYSPWTFSFEIKNGVVSSIRIAQ
jgi:hypothetical protein